MTTTYLPEKRDTKLGELARRRNALESAMRKLDKEFNDRLRDIVSKDFPGEDPHHLEVSTFWECPDPDGGTLNDPDKPSPTGFCVYGDDHDTCLYCGAPEERK